MELLVVIDMQRDFIDGALGTKEAVAILPYVKETVKSHKGKVLFTRDTHKEDYLSTREGEKLPVPHCIFGTDGWQIHPELLPYVTQAPIDKETFGSVTLGERVRAMEGVSGVTLMGLCTDICVISNAMLLRAFCPELPIRVDARGCAGVTPESHERALDAMASCQIEISGR